MLFAYVKQGALIQTFSSDSFEVEGQYVHSASSLSKLEQINLGLYEFIPAEPQSPKYAKVMGSTFEVDTGAGVVTETLVIQPFSPADFETAKVQAKNNIDVWSDDKRLTYVSPGMYTQQEYIQAETEAKAWLADTTKPAPMSISCWATAKGWDNQAAAEDIVNTAELFRNLLMQIRSIRLIGKAAVDAATTGDELDAAISQVKLNLEQLPTP